MDKDLELIATLTFAGMISSLGPELDKFTARELKMMESLVRELQREIAFAQVRKGA